MKTTLTLSTVALLLATTAMADTSVEELEARETIEIASLADRVQGSGFWATLVSWDDDRDDDDDDRYDDDEDDDDYDDDEDDRDYGGDDDGDDD